MICASVSVIIAILCLVSVVLIGIIFSNKVSSDENSAIIQQTMRNLSSEIVALKKEIYEIRESNADLVAKDVHAEAQMERHSKMISGFTNKFENIESKVKVLQDHHENNQKELTSTEVPVVQDVTNASSRFFITQQLLWQVAIGYLFITLIF